MVSKRPSSLDYDAHLHELALMSWRRALVARAVSRAEANAQKLTASHDKLWRFVGFVHLALARLGGGRASAALDALADAARTYPEGRELVALARAQTAHVHLETRSPRQAIDALRGVVSTPETEYWRALALARLSRGAEARELVSAVDDEAMVGHLLFELDDDLVELRRGAERIGDDELASPKPAAPIYFAFGTALERRGECDEAGQVFTRVAAAADVLSYWPVPYARSLYRAGRWAARDGREEARDMFTAFLQLWSDGEMDRAEVAEARQFVNA